MKFVPKLATIVTIEKLTREFKDFWRRKLRIAGSWKLNKNEQVQLVADSFYLGSNSDISSTAFCVYW